MIRLIVNIADAGLAANVGGPVQQRFKTFDIEHAELEKLLTPDPRNSYRETYLSGCEIIASEAVNESGT
jgi:hypothetical protein